VLSGLSEGWARAGSPRGIARPGLPQILMCTVVHAARHLMSSLRYGTQSGARSVAGAGSAPATDFTWDRPILVGTTPVGRTTLVVLKMNHPDRLELRRLLIAAGLFPP
jgi:hypothetical protein